MLIYIVRHGETRANVDGYLQGWSNDPINANGRKLAVLTGQGMRGINFDYCISSPLIRARETAEIVLRESGNKAPIVFDDRVKEINFGDYELMSTKSSEFDQFFSDPFNCPQFPNGENVQMVIKRTQDFLSELIQKDDAKSYLIVTHGCALRAMLNYFYTDPSDYWHGHVPYNCCVSIIDAIEGKGQLIADDKVYYDQTLIVDRYSRE